jgi:hypothetical protein
MSVTLDELLMLAGRLDDSAGFDTPRERFRRFLIEYVTDARIARALIEQCRLLDEQHHRALQDLVVLLGRSLGFETRFGTYSPVSGALKYDGHWRSRAHLDIVLELRTNQTLAADPDGLVRSIRALSATSAPNAEVRPMGLCVVTALYASRGRLEDVVAATQPEFPIRVVALRALLSLADMVSAGRLKHDEVVKLIESGSPLDFVAELLDRFAHTSAPSESPTPSPNEPARPGRPLPVALRQESSEHGFWLATVAGDHAVTPEQFVEVVIGRRHIFGVSPDGEGGARPGDSICFYISGRGAVGRAQVASIEQNGVGLRDAHQYAQLLRLEHTELHLSEPIVPDFETQLRLRAARGASGAIWQPFRRISEQDFVALTTRAESRSGGRSSAPPSQETMTVSAADPQSRE